MSRKVVVPVIVLALAGTAAYSLFRPPPAELLLTGIVTTSDVIVGPQVGGQVSELLVAEGDSVRPGQRVALLAPAELQADRTYFTHSAEALTAAVSAAEASLAAAIAQEAEAVATRDNARQTLQRDSSLAKTGGITAEAFDAARTAYTVAAARVDAAATQVAAARSALVTARQQRDAAEAQATKAAVRLGYTEIVAPLGGIVDVRAARVGEVVAAGQPIVTLIDPDDLWIRADVEESYIDRIRLGDSLTVRLPSGATRRGAVFFRGVDADFATQRDVSRTKRDIKTFEIRLRVDNRDRRLAVGMTATVVLPLGPAAG